MEGSLFCIFWTAWKGRNKVTFDNDNLLIWSMKYSFAYNIWVWDRVFDVNKPKSLISFKEFFYILLEGRWLC